MVGPPCSTSARLLMLTILVSVVVLCYLAIAMEHPGACKGREPRELNPPFSNPGESESSERVGPMANRC